MYALEALICPSRMPSNDGRPSRPRSESDGSFEFSFGISEAGRRDTGAARPGPDAAAADGPKRLKSGQDDEGASPFADEQLEAQHRQTWSEAQELRHGAGDADTGG